MSKDIDVYGIGNAIVDVQFTISEQQLAESGLIKAGMTLVGVKQQLATLEMFAGNSVNTQSGGSGANTVVALAQLGCSAAYGCLVGDDDYGHSYLRDMLTYKVQTNTLPLEEESTGTCLVFITPDAERTMSTCLGVSSRFGRQHLSEPYISRAKWLYIEGYLLSSTTGAEAALEAVKMAKNHGTKVAITFSDCFIVENFRPALTQIVEQSDLIFANKAEALAYFKVQSVEEVVNKIPFGVITLSEKGALICQNGIKTHIEPFAASAVDDTGAGDMFAGGFLYGLCKDMSIEKAGKIACLLASKVVSQVGPRINGNLSNIISEQNL